MSRPFSTFLLPLLLVMAATVAALAQEGESGASEAGAAPPRLTITYLANEGVLLEGEQPVGHRRVAIDALHRPYGPPGEYLHLPKEERERFEAAEEPYDDIDLLLVTHVHRDHFHPEAVGAYLSANPGTTLVSSQQVVESVKEGFGKPEVEPRMRELTPDFGKSLRYQEVGVPLTLLGLHHGSQRFQWIQNLGYLVELAGYKILHIGDADMAAGNFEPFRLQNQKIDVVLAPAWFFLYPEGQYVLRKLVTADQLIAIHVPPSRRDEHEAAILRPFPEAVVFKETGQTFTIP